ncbi:hypothetical protein [Paraburkholderia mimosarum]|uniref:hypothetical protein n=1 Tax=Paraburkholderia mimosarum TaxID=312026 RepID=UPI00041F422F|nr:hypothetical protein [Paraburkholderia mimosarum]
MDLTTIETYTSRAGNFAAEWANQPAPDDLYARLGESARDAAGRLYSAFDRALVNDALQGTAIALDERSVNRSSGKRVQRIVAIRA